MALAPGGLFDNTGNHPQAKSPIEQGSEQKRECACAPLHCTFGSDVFAFLQKLGFPGFKTVKSCLAAEQAGA